MNVEREGNGRASKLVNTFLRFKTARHTDFEYAFAKRAEESSESVYSALLAQERAYFLAQVKEVSKTTAKPPELRICTRTLLAHKNALYSVCAAEPERFLALHLPSVEERGESAYFADARAFKGVLLDTASASKSLEDGEMSFVPPCRLCVQGLSSAAERAETETKKALRLTAECQSFSKTLAVLEIEAPEAEWIYPVVSETDVFIVQVYAVETDDGTIHIE